jgi:hypothetical protein
MRTTSNDEDNYDRMNDQLLKRWSKNELIKADYFSDDDDEEEDTDKSPPVSLQRNININSSRRNDSSLVETDTSVLLIAKKIQEMKKQSTKDKRA